MAGAGRQLQLRARLHSASIVVQLFSCVRLLATPGAAARQTSLSITNSPSLLKLTSNESLMPSKHFLLCRPLLLLPSVFPSIRVSSNEPGLHIRWPNDWSFSFSISPSSGHSGLIPFRMDLLAVPGTLKSLLVSVGCRVVLLDVLVSKHLIKKGVCRFGSPPAQAHRQIHEDLCPPASQSSGGSLPGAHLSLPSVQCEASAGLSRLSFICRALPTAVHSDSCF